ncbi:MAG: multifunctional CCA addition/repair protein [Gammaproteobacteria bacterium WSBS_2016_MAG_OTU1]
MRTYLVGGAVRDKLLERPPGDRDFVVVGTTPEEMLSAGYRAVGVGFPVFLHPKTNEEYALARTEKKHGRGYRGFVFYTSPDVSLEEDLRRRDLTINAIAQEDDGTLIDPFGGVADIAAKQLRHISSAFAEDPVRVLRVARFAAMFPDFSIADDTMDLMKKMVRCGETEHLVAERVWQELARGFAAACPSRMIKVLAECGLLAQIMPEVAALDGVAERLDYHPEGDTFVHTMMVVDAAADLQLSAPEVFAALLHDIGKAKTPASVLPSHHGHEARGAKLATAMCERLVAPNEFADLAILAAAEHGNIHNSLAARASTVADILSRLDAYRRPERAISVVRVSEADYAYWHTRRGTEYPQGAFMRAAMIVAANIPAGDIAQKTIEKHGSNSQKIAEQIRQARILAIRKTRELPTHTNAFQKMQEYNAAVAAEFADKDKMPDKDIKRFVVLRPDAK